MSAAYLAVKYAITAAAVVLISEVARRNERVGGLVAALPLVTFLTLVWLHVEGAPPRRIGDHAWYTFWYVIPTLPMFLAFPAMLERLGFWGSLAGSVVLTLGCFVGFSWFMRRFGVVL